MPDEPGHEFLSAGATCGCGADGCLEAHVSGSGIERKYGIRGEDIPADDWRWAAVTNNLALGVNQMLERYAADGHVPTHLHFFGSVALKGPGVLDGLRNKLPAIRDPKETPRIGTAAFGDNSGLHGAYLAALQTLR
jgi:glucokinase